MHNYSIARFIEKQRDFYSQGAQFGQDQKKFLTFAFPPVLFINNLRQNVNYPLRVIKNAGEPNEEVLAI